MDPIEYFANNKYAVVENMIEPSVCRLIYNYFILKACTNQEFGEAAEANKLYSRAPYIRGVYCDVLSEALLAELEPIIKQVTQKNVAPSYTYSRVYINGEGLPPHTDRPSCQYSVTLNIGGAPWPIYFGVHDDNSTDNVYDGDKRVRVLSGQTLKPGDGIVYSGEDLVHWREDLREDHCVQVFLHYVDQDDDKYKPHIYDGRKNIGYIKR
tara:strand:+ start:3299 stop:3928 length:630 start_codon:yes stop_codon:yes gene_type:complete